MSDVHVHAICGKNGWKHPTYHDCQTLFWVVLWCQLTNFPFFFVAHVGNNPCSNLICTKKRYVCMWLYCNHQDLPGATIFSLFWFRNKICVWHFKEFQDFVATLALGSRPRQKGRKGVGQKECEKEDSHFQVSSPFQS